MYGGSLGLGTHVQSHAVSSMGSSISQFVLLGTSFATGVSTNFSCVAPGTVYRIVGIIVPG